MTGLLKITAVFIRANVDSSEALKAADALADMTEGRITAEAAVSVISSFLNKDLEMLSREYEIKECIPNGATAFVDRKSVV